MKALILALGLLAVGCATSKPRAVSFDEYPPIGFGQARFLFKENRCEEYFAHVAKHHEEWNLYHFEPRS